MLKSAASAVVLAGIILVGISMGAVTLRMYSLARRLARR